MANTYSDLKAWQKDMELVVDVYRTSRSFPKDELYGLTSQMRRAAVSVPSNIAEGKGRFSPRELIHFLYCSRGSLLELETQLVIAHRLGYVGDSDYLRLRTQSSEVGKILNGLIRRFQVAA